MHAVGTPKVLKLRAKTLNAIKASIAHILGLRV